MDILMVARELPRGYSVLDLLIIDSVILFVDEILRYISRLAYVEFVSAEVMNVVVHKTCEDVLPLVISSCFCSLYL